MRFDRTASSRRRPFLLRKETFYKIYPVLYKHMFQLEELGSIDAEMEVLVVEEVSNLVNVMSDFVDHPSFRTSADM